VRIAITADPYLPVPPALYGGIERVVDMLVCGLVERGHEVTLFAHPASRTCGTLIGYGSPPHAGVRHRLAELCQLGGSLWRRRRAFDLVHSFGRLRALAPVLPLRSVPKIQSYQREVPWRGVRTAVLMAGDSLGFTGCSSSLYRDRSRMGAHAGRWRTVFNGVDPRKYRAMASVAADAPLAFLGRVEPIKGAHHAIRIARAAGRRHVLAGTRAAAGPAADYFDREIAPHVDGAAVRYVGPVDDARKDALLGAAAALLMPVDWEEPFGLVMAEALACGTPVIGFARGSVPEVVRDGVNGYVCAGVEEAVAAVARIGRLDRTAIRADFESRFSSGAVVDAYERLYREMASRAW
jgi:glycosyltransferase involved in cell wall biosynthesis